MRHACTRATASVGRLGMPTSMHQRTAAHVSWVVCRGCSMAANIHPLRCLSNVLKSMHLAHLEALGEQGGDSKANHDEVPRMGRSS